MISVSISSFLQSFAGRWRLAPLLACAALLGGCASLPGTATIAVDGRPVEYLVARHGGPVVVFENGLDGTLDWWAKVWPEVARDSSALAYNRPGYGRSQAVATPRDGTHVVAELRALLQATQLPPPYVLVGHSLGGLYLQQFARQYPGEVQALVLVDSTHPEQLRGQGAPENWPAWVRVGFNALTSETAKQEFQAIDATGQRVLALPPLPPATAVLILSALRPLQERSALADDGNGKRADLLRLYPGAKAIGVDSGHAIPLDQPEAVIAAIREALGRGPGR
ncbi:MAG: alpha/beta hydrolase [Proteobacteria bacterium]|nr:alpha/beta hydrolase [Pseudomonadota bacterium]